MVKLKRAYEPPAREDGQRFLVERLWPRGGKEKCAPLGYLAERCRAERPSCGSGSATISESGLSFKSATGVN